MVHLTSVWLEREIVKNGKKVFACEEEGWLVYANYWAADGKLLKITLDSRWGMTEEQAADFVRLEMAKAS